MLHSGLPCVLGLEGKFLLYVCLILFVRLLKLILMFGVPIFFHFLADRKIWSPPTSLWFWCGCTRVLLIWVLGFDLYLQFWICHSGGGSVVGRGDWPVFLSSKRLPDIFPATGQGVLAQMGVLSKGGGYSVMIWVFGFQDLWGSECLFEVVVQSPCWA